MPFEGLPDFVADHLQRIAKQQGFVDGYEVKHESASKVGDSYNADLLSIKLLGYRSTSGSVDLVQNELALICKIQPKNVGRRENCGSAILFRQEVYMYKVLLPALATFQQKHEVPADIAFTCFPKCYVAIHEEGSSDSVIILEDLRASGFEMWNKKKPTEFEIVRLLMEQIGRFHGLSIAIRHRDPEVFKNILNMPSILTDLATTPGLSMLLQLSFTQTLSLMDNVEDLQSVAGLATDCMKIFLDGVNAERLGNYGVLSHGDCWIANSMFLFDKGSPKSIALLDWQMSRITSPAIDLSYYLFSSTEKSLRDAHLGEFLNIYYTNLAATIRSTGGDPEELFPESELQRQLREFGIFGVVMSQILIPLVLADSANNFNFDELADSKAEDLVEAGPIKGLGEAKVKEYVRRFKEVLTDARQYGWL